MSHCFRGLYLGGNPTPMGQQGVGDTASANTWWDVSYKHTYCDIASVTPSQNKMYNPHTGGNAFGEYYPNPYIFYPSNGNIIPQTNPSPGTLHCNNSGTPPDSNLLRVQYYENIAKDSLNTVGHSASIKFNMKENLRLILQSDSTLLENNVLEQFSDSVDLLNMGKIIEAKNTYVPNLTIQDSIDFANKVQNISQGSIIPEQLNKEVLELLSQNVSLKDSVYSVQTMLRLRQIAWLCPYTKGNAVHLARKILSGINPKDIYYLNACEMQTDQNGKRMIPLDKEDEEELTKFHHEPIHKVNISFSIIPNPNNGIFRVDFPKDQILKLELFGVEGKYIQDLKINNEGQLDIQQQSKGAYLIKLLEKNGNVNTLKLIMY